MDSPWFLSLAITLIVAQGFALFLALFEPTLPYTIKEPLAHPLQSDEFLRILARLCDTAVFRNTRVEVLTNGEVFYEAELQAIRAAQRSITLEAYIFQKGKVTAQFI